MKAAKRIARLPRGLVLALALATSLAQAQVPPACRPTDPWTTPIDLGVALRDDVPAVVGASENGEAMVVWFGTSESGARVVQTRRYARVQSLSPRWQPAVVAKVLKGAADPVAASASMDASGNAFAAWETGDHRIEVSRFTRAANGTGQWGSSTTLSGAGIVASAPSIVVRSDGKKALAFWQTVVNNKRALQWALFDALSGAWSPAATALATNADEGLAPAAAFTADGYALLAYQYISGADTPTTKRRVRVFGQWFDASSQTWSKPATLSDADGTVTPWATPLVPRPRVTLDGDGHGLAAWRYRDPLGACEQVRATNFDGASKAWSSQTQTVSGCFDPLAGSTLQRTDNVLAASIAPLNDRTTFLLWGHNSSLGANPQARRRGNASASWDPTLQIPQPVVGHSIEIGDAGLAGSTHPSALWVQPSGIEPNSGFGLYASTHSDPSPGCPAWSGLARIADVSRLRPLLRTPDRAAVPIAVWIDPAGATPRVYASVRRRTYGF